MRLLSVRNGRRSLGGPRKLSSVAAKKAICSRISGGIMARDKGRSKSMYAVSKR